MNKTAKCVLILLTVLLLTPHTALAGSARHFVYIQRPGYEWVTRDFERVRYETEIQDVERVRYETVNLDVAAVSTGWRYTVAITSDGALWAWGNNEVGQLGDGTTTNRSSPVHIMDDVIAVSAGNSHAAAITSDGRLWAWGLNSRSQLGDGTTTNRSSPVHIMDDVIAVSTGGSHSLAITSDGRLWAWGCNSFTQLGGGTIPSSPPRSTPVHVKDDVITVSTMHRHSLAITSDGRLWAWGSNSHGELGDGTTTHTRRIPVHVMDDVIVVSAGVSQSLAITSDDRLWAWGRNSQGQLGDGTTTSSSSPVHIMDDVIDAADNMAITSDGALWTLGAGAPVTHIMDDVIAVSTGGSRFAITADGALWAWGINSYGQLGDGTTTRRNDPVEIAVGHQTPVIYIVQEEVQVPVTYTIQEYVRVPAQINYALDTRLFGTWLAVAVEGMSRAEVTLGEMTLIFFDDGSGIMSETVHGRVFQDVFEWHVADGYLFIDGTDAAAYNISRDTLTITFEGEDMILERQD